MAPLVPGAGGEQFQQDTGFVIGVINGNALRQLGSALHSRPMAGPGSVLEPSCADLFRASTLSFRVFPSLRRQTGPSPPARTHSLIRHARTCSAHPRLSLSRASLPYAAKPARAH
jgi:hypothetical protein